LISYSDVESRRFETVSATSNSLILKADQTHRWLNTNTQILHSIEDNVEDLSVQQQLQTSILASHVSSHERFDGKLDVLITGMNELIMTQQSTLFSPTASKTLTSLDAEPTTSLISRPTTVSNSVAGHDHLSDFVCRCPKRQRNASPGAYHFFGIIWTSYPAHLPGCSLHNPKQRAHIAGATFKIPVRQAVPFVEAVLTWGAVPFQYTVSVRNTVPYSAPTLSIIRKLSEYLSYGNNVRTSNLGKALNITLRSLSLLFREGRARPSDADIFGRNILHVSSN
jgi:hypothetical protein